MNAPIPATMQALRWHGPRDLRLEEVPVPRPGPGEILIKVDRVGLCGSDLEEYREGPVAIPAGAAPLTLGHEVIGTVVSSRNGLPAVDTRVVPDVVVGCGHCWWCRRHEEGLCPQLLVRGQQQDGGLAEFMIADAATCVTLPDGLDTDVAAFAEPTAVAVRAVRKAGDLAGATVVVIGGGTIGNLIAQAALGTPASAVIVIDPIAQRRSLARQVGAMAADPDDSAETVHHQSGGRGADVVLECSGALGAPEDAVTLSRRGGTVVLVGFRNQSLRLPWLDVVLGERRLLGSAAHLWDVDVAGAVALLAGGCVDPRPLHSDTIALDGAVQAFQRLDTDPSITKLLVAP